MEEKITLQQQKEFYDKKYTEAWLHENESYYKWIISIAGKHFKSGNFLDVACGEGFALVAAKEKGFEPHGTDISTTALKRAAQMCKGAKLTECPADKIPYPDKYFKVVTCLGSLEHFADQKKSLAEMKRITDDDGILIATLPNKRFIGDIVKGAIYKKKQTHDQPLERFYTLREGKKIFTENGFNVIKVKKYNSPVSLKGRFVWRRVLRHMVPTQLSYHFCFVCEKKG